MYDTPQSPGSRLVRSLGFFIAVAAASACGGAARSPEIPLWERPGLYGAVRPEMGPPQPGDQAPDFELQAAAGPFRLASQRGSWVLLHFTASWCPYCDAEVAHLGELSDAYASRNVKVVLVGVKEDPARWSDYTRGRVPASIVVLSDERGDAATRYAPPRAQPSFRDRAQAVLDSTLVIDPEGKIRLFLLPDSKHFDPSFKGVRQELDRLLPAAQGDAWLLAPERVVTLGVDVPPGIEAGGAGEVRVALKIAAGYHVMSDRPSDRMYIATQVRFDDAPDVSWGPARYSEPVTFQLADKAISTFQGDAAASVPFRVAAGAPEGSRKLAGTVRYQACTEASCLFPVTRRIEATLAVSGPRR